MADTDVVRHDLSVQFLDKPLAWDRHNQPVPVPKAPSPEVSVISPSFLQPPVTSRVSDEELVTPPYQSVGKLGVILATGEEKGCSGWVVARRALITAGHCVYHPDYGGWIKRAGFAPRYNNSVVTGYDVQTVYTLRGWFESHQWMYDMAACVVTEGFTASEPPLAFDTLLPGLNFMAIGYPIHPLGAYDFNGKRMWKCVGGYIKQENDILFAVNNLTGGASGGPWCDTGAGHEVTGITSRRLDSDGVNVARSPLLANGFQNLYDAVKDL